MDFVKYENKRILYERGSTLIEYALIAAILIIGLIAVMPSTEDKVACRANKARSQYSSYDLSPGVDTSPCLPP